MITALATRDKQIGLLQVKAFLGFAFFDLESPIILSRTRSHQPTFGLIYSCSRHCWSASIHADGDDCDGAGDHLNEAVSHVGIGPVRAGEQFSPFSEKGRLTRGTFTSHSCLVWLPDLRQPVMLSGFLAPEQLHFPAANPKSPAWLKHAAVGEYEW